MALACSKRTISIVNRNNVFHSDFYCLNCLHSFATEKKRESYKKVCENKDFCNAVTPSEDTKILGLNQHHRSYKAPFNIDADLECFIEKIDECKTNPENSLTRKINEHIPSGFLMFTISSLHFMKT